MVFDAVITELPRISEIEFHSLFDVGDKLKIEISLKGSCFSKMVFDDPLCYRVMDEGDAMIFVHWLSTQDIKSCLLKFSKSDFLEWFSNQSYNTKDYLNVSHYCLITCSHIIDVIGFDDPDIE
ncbi:hypothetical protein [Labrenzia sp. OB1]|uniref:hypothetical protein n=1 Tax=Labrenzia sp. OB1 TaxID=1561204 RepID=UPI0007B29FA2|nr:hypothetical protein [Labrenzia sp. OB1]KZM46162.1 hypothetical protein OA90_26770 [Labrenzia sp. OB1]